MLSITFHGLDGLQEAWRRAPEVVRDELTQFAHGGVAYLVQEVQDRTPAAHDTLRGSIQGEVDPGFAGVLGVVGTAQPHALPVELGSKPHMPPIQPIEDWVRLKLGVRGNEVRRAAWAVARKIKKRGTQGHFMFRDAHGGSSATA